MRSRHRQNPIALERHTLLRAVQLLGLSPALAMAQTTQPVTFESLDKGITLNAYWTAPQAHGAEKKFPAVVALHGCGGLPADRALLSYPRGRYVKMLADQGYGVLYVDSFTGRNTKEICSQTTATRRITEFTRRFDVYAALDWLATQPHVDAQRLAVLGWSHGGQTVLAAADRTEALVKNAKVQPKALVAFYPGCRRFGEMWRYESVAPLYILTGALDNWTPPAPCRDLVDKLRRHQPDQIVKYIEYPDSHHGFDSPLPVRERQNVGGTRSGTATVGGNAEAREHSAKELLEFLRTQF